MKYMLLVYTNENDWTEAERMACMQESTELCHDLNKKGQYVSASPLHYVSLATSVRVRNNKRLITDGPFAETTEQLGGYYVIDVPDLDAAIAIAARIPGSKRGTIEVRPIFELSDLPKV